MRTAPATVFLALTVIALGGCPPPSQQTSSPQPTPVAPDPPRDGPTAPSDGAGTLAADGDSCLAASECASGLCEGEGCGDDQPGVCVSSQRRCTRDLRPYCGCDEQTFRGSGSCPNKRFASRSECVASGSAKAADGERCSRGDDCDSGICEGQGCGAGAGTCVSRQRPCTADLRPYCGCDGVTFHSSGTCANRVYQHEGDCKTK